MPFMASHCLARVPSALTGEGDQVGGVALDLLAATRGAGLIRFRCFVSRLLME